MECCTKFPTERPPRTPTVGKRSQKAVVQENNPYAIGVLSRAFNVLAIFSHAKPSLSLGES